MLESKFQSKLIQELKCEYPGAIITKMDAGYIQGIPDLLVLYKDRWAVLECKKYSGASKRPNQQFYVDTMNEMSFAAFINPENKERVLYELQRSFERGR